MDKTLRQKVVKATGCSLQYKGFPCNSCFHSLDLPLKEDIHEYWLAVLADRGDYPELTKRPDLVEELKSVL